MNFGPDPNAEAAKKREMKIAYARQLQEQQYKQQEPMNKPPPRTGSNYGYSDSVSDEQNSMRDHVIDDGRMNRDNLLSAKRQQQKQYHDEITRAAAAPAIYSERGSLRGGIESRRQQQLQSDGSNLRSNEQGTVQLEIPSLSSSYSFTNVPVTHPGKLK